MSGWQIGEPFKVTAADIKPFVAAIRRVTEALARITKLPPWLLDPSFPDDPSRPRPLCIDGHEYRRRRKHR